MVQQCSRRAYGCALENFTSCGKFWKIVKFWKPAAGQPPAGCCIRAIFVRSNSTVRKVAFFYNVAFCDLSYNKNRNRVWKILEAPHNYFQLLVLVVRYMKTWWPQFLRWSDFPSFSPASSKFPKFSSLWFSFSSRHSCYSCSFSSFFRHCLTYRHRCGRTSRYDLAMGLRATGKIWKKW